MDTPLRIAIGITSALVLGAVVLSLTNDHPRGKADYEFPDHDLPSHVAGRWDWSTRGHLCGDSAHVISFAADRHTMTIAKPRQSAADTGWTATYDVLSLSPTRLRGAIRGEDRRTDRGVPVVWDLVLFGPDEYRWHRTDWPSWEYTASIYRCKAKDDTGPGS
jgi:hypothetical protein